jgi:hypothetical protein
MKALSKNSLSNIDFRNLLTSIDDSINELVFDNNSGAFSSDRLIESEEFGIEYHLEILETGITTPATYQDPQEYTALSRDIHIDNINIVSNDCEPLEVTSEQMEIIKKALIKSIQ